ncbi:MAG: GtrA family protein [Oscillospiraceae bacterium]|nr:GtrA family protein [Oscillospiraceae bacterium]
MDREPDIFDRLMAAPLLRPLQPFWQKHREALLYLFFGGLTTLLSILLFWLFTALGLDVLIANVLSWILAVLFAYLTNAKWVFEARPQGFGERLRLLLRFYAGRLATLGAEELLLWLFIKRLGLPPMPVKIAAQLVVIVLNYVVSKLLVFRKKEKKE